MRFPFMCGLGVISLMTALTCQASLPQSSAPLSLEARSEIKRTLSEFHPLYGDPRTNLDEEQAQDILAEMLARMKKHKNPLFLDPRSGIPLTEEDPQDFHPDQLKGCVSKTICTGTGENRTCTTWEVCLSND